MFARRLYNLTKPGIIYANAFTAAVGFLFACKWKIDWLLFVSLVVGTSLVIASACVCNNYIDRDIDKKMARTRERALARGTISGREALLFAGALGVLGFAILALETNALTVVIGAVAFIDYVILYGISKRRSVHGTVVGSISGAAPVAAGYVAVSGRLTLDAWLLFAIMVAWQMPHFYAIAIFRGDDYAAAGIPVWPVRRGIASTKRQILLYIGALCVALVALSVYGSAGVSFAVFSLALGISWAVLAARGVLRPVDDRRWARQLFFVSLFVLLGIMTAVSVARLLP